MKNSICIVGGDGFCGWALSLRLSNLGAKIVIIDNLSRRNIDIKNNTNSLIPIFTIEERLKKWEELTGKKIDFYNIDVSNYKNFDQICNILKIYNIDTLIHLGEQRSAPYSMKNKNTRQYTIKNNLLGTHLLLDCIIETNIQIHFIHLGSMGVYGYGTIPDTVIPEGYLEIKMKKKDEWSEPVSILHPSYPGSIYHLTKTQDALYFQFFAKNYNCRITDLHQGIVWGVSTKETMLAPELMNRLDYDSDYGTVLNRFLLQSALNIPLTLYGTGNQTRAFIHIENSLDCIVIAINNPPKNGDKVNIFNQMTETHRLIDLAKQIKIWFPSTEISYLDNPRIEFEKNELIVTNEKFCSLGLIPIHLNYELANEVRNLANLYSDRLIKDVLYPMSFWKKSI